jgi:hypothetical protein
MGPGYAFYAWGIYFPRCGNRGPSLKVHHGQCLTSMVRLAHQTVSFKRCIFFREAKEGHFRKTNICSSEAMTETSKRQVLCVVVSFSAVRGPHNSRATAESQASIVGTGLSLEPGSELLGCQGPRDSGLIFPIRLFSDGRLETESNHCDEFRPWESPSQVPSPHYLI